MSKQNLNHSSLITLKQKTQTQQKTQQKIQPKTQIQNKQTQPNKQTQLNDKVHEQTKRLIELQSKLKPVVSETKLYAIDKHLLQKVYTSKGHKIKPTKKLAKATLTAVSALSILGGTMTSVYAQAQSPGGTKTRDKTKRNIKGVYVTGNLNKDLMTLKSNKTKIAQTNQQTKTQNNSKSQQVSIPDSTVQQEVLKESNVKQYKNKKPFAIKANVSQTESQTKAINKTQTQEVKTIDENKRILTIKDSEATYTDTLNKTNENQVADITTLYSIPKRFKSQVLISDLKVKYNGIIYYHFVSQDSQLQGYVKDTAVKEYIEPKVTETPSVANRDYINFSDNNKIVTKPIPYTSTKQDSYTVKKGTIASVVSAIDVELPVSTQSIITLVDKNNSKVYLENNSSEYTINQSTNKVESNSGQVKAYTSKDLATKTDILLDNYKVASVNTKFINKPTTIQYYKINIPNITESYYIQANQVTKQHYGFASATQADANIYHVNISSMTYDNPTSYKDSKVKDNIKYDTFVKSQDKVTVVNTDNSTTDWYHITQNGQDKGYVEANKLSKLAENATVKATITDTFNSLATKYQLDINNLKEYNPEIASIGEVSANDLVYLYRRDDLDTVKDGYTQMQDIFDKLNIKNSDLKRKMIAAKTTKYDTDSKLVSQYSYLIPYIKYRGFLPSVTFGQAVLESTDGESGLAVKNKNLFGIKGAYKGKKSSWSTSEYYDGKTESTINDDFRVYPNGSESFKDYLDLLEKSYDAQDIDDPQTAIEAIKDGGYATDPNYVDSIMNTIKEHTLTNLDK